MNHLLIIEISKQYKKGIWLSGNLQLNTLMKLLTILDSRLRENDTFFQSVPPFPVITAKPVLDLIGEQGSRN